MDTANYNLPLEENWLFHKGDFKAYSSLPGSAYHGTSQTGGGLEHLRNFHRENEWEPIRLPHDWFSFQKIDKKQDATVYSKKRGVAWYKNQMVEQLPIPTKEGHIFKGWVVGEENVGTSYAPAANTHMVASWATAYQVTFVLNNGQENVVITVEENTVASIQYPEKDGFIFAGWFIDEACTVEYSDANIIENTTIYAKWEDIPDYVGTYAGVEVWGSTSGDDGNLSGNKKLTISESFSHCRFLFICQWLSCLHCSCLKSIHQFIPSFK